MTNKIVNIVMVDSRFLQRQQKRSRENQLIHRRLSKNTSFWTQINQPEW